MKNIDINPSTTVYELLVAYPELEEVLIKITPVFKKLKNPILRNTVAKVATLKHASVVGGVELSMLISVLRETVGLGDIKNIDSTFSSKEYLNKKPKWFLSDKIIASIDESKLDGLNKMPITFVLHKAKDTKNGEIIELITTFLPAPGIDLMQKKGYETWTSKESDHLFKSYFKKRNINMVSHKDG